MNTVVKTTNGKYVWIDTCITPMENKWDTIVVPCNSRGFVSSWKELEMRHYENGVDAMAGHRELVKKWENRSLI